MKFPWRNCWRTYHQRCLRREVRKVVPKTVKIHLLKMKVRHQGKRWAAYKFVFKAVAHPDLELR